MSDQAKGHTLIRLPKSAAMIATASAAIHYLSNARQQLISIRPAAVAGFDHVSLGLKAGVMSGTSPITPNGFGGWAVSLQNNENNRLTRICRLRSNRELAAAAGISERHFYRLKKMGALPTSDGGSRLYKEMVGPVHVAKLLEQLGYDRLLGTPAHLYMDKFIAALVLHLAVLQEELPDAIETKLAHRTAKRSVEELRLWHAQLNELES